VATSPASGPTIAAQLMPEDEAQMSRRPAGRRRVESSPGRARVSAPLPRHGAMVVENAFENAGRTVDYRTLPRVTFTSPNMASVGITDTEARKAGIDCECRTAPLELVPRALVNRDTRGLVKVAAERKTGIVRGIHMLAHNAADSILAGVYAIECRMTVRQLGEIWCPYLTMSEGIKLAAQAFTMDVAKLVELTRAPGRQRSSGLERGPLANGDEFCERLPAAL
jgi:mercuric reductase